MFKDSLETFIADLVLQTLSWMAQEDRDCIQKRQRKGIDAVLKSGISFEQPKAQVNTEFIEVYDR